jgi:mRNA interferase RelE/StbE
MPYEIRFKKSALKELEKLPLNIQETISLDVAELSTEPRPSGCRKLKGNDNYWRIRIGDYRVVYTIIDNILQIEIIRIAHRKEVY